MIIELCCSEMGFALKRDEIKVDTALSFKRAFKIALNGTGIHHCPYCGENVTIEMVGEEEVTNEQNPTP